MTDGIAFCPYCGRERLGGAPFCAGCGKPLGQAGATPVPVSPAAGVQAVSPAPASGGNPPPATPLAAAGGTQGPETAEVDLLGAAAQRVQGLTTAQWALIAGIGQAIAAVLPWASTSFLNVSVSPLAGIGQNLFLTAALAAAVVALVSSAVMANDAARAAQKLWRNWFLLGSAATLVCGGLVLFSFITTKTYGVVSPGLGLLLAAGSGVLGVAVMLRPARP